MGRACPEPLKNGRVTVCLAGWSETLGFVRLYPTPPSMPWKQWDIVCVDAEKSPQDSRIESYKITGSREEWDILPTKVRVVGHANDDWRRSLIVYLADEGIHSLREAHRSLGIIKPTKILRTYFRKNPHYVKMWQMALPGMTDLGRHRVKRDFPLEPRIKYTYENCQTKYGYHDHQVLEWGFYEWLRKNPGRADQVWQNAGIGDPNMSIYFLVGNQIAHPTSFMIISVLRFASSPVTPPMFPYRKLPDPN